MLIYLFLIAVGMLNSTAQSLSPTLHSTAAIYKLNVSDEHAYISIGEVFTKTHLNGEDNLLTVGMLQPFTLEISDTKTISVDSTGWKFYPNPFESIINVNIEDLINNELNFAIYNVLGILVKTEVSNVSLNKDLIKIDLSTLPDGVYFIQISDNLGNKWSPKQIVKSR